MQRKNKVKIILKLPLRDSLLNKRPPGYLQYTTLVSLNY